MDPILPWLAEDRNKLSPADAKKVVEVPEQKIKDSKWEFPELLLTFR